MLIDYSLFIVLFKIWTVKLLNVEWLNDNIFWYVFIYIYNYLYNYIKFGMNKIIWKEEIVINVEIEVSVFY